jgi:hypothetical protein
MYLSSITSFQNLADETATANVQLILGTEGNDKVHVHSKVLQCYSVPLNTSFTNAGEVDMHQLFFESAAPNLKSVM